MDLPVSIVATRQSGEGKGGAARGGLADGKRPGEDGREGGRGRGSRDGWKMRGGHEKLSFIRMQVESELRRICEGCSVHMNGSNLIDHIKGINTENMCSAAHQHF